MHRTAFRAALFVLTVSTLAALSGVLRNEFVAWDDDYLIVNNPHTREVSADSLRWMFTTTLGGHYQPLTWLSYALETKFLWGVNAAGFHFTNLLLHGATAIGLFLCIRQMLGPGDRQLLGATVATLLWAVHPLRVESVAWATERRDVLSGALLVFSVLFYLRGQSAPRSRGSLLTISLACYVCSLLSKASGMTLPLVLLILDVFPMRRRMDRTVLVEKTWYLLPAIGAAAMAAYAQAASGALRTFDQHPVSLRIAQAFYGDLFYLGKTLWPADLVPLYEQRPEATATEPVFIACVVGFLWLSALAWTLRRRVPAVLATWVGYLVLLSPMLGFAQSGPQVVADRYSYLPSMALMTLVAGAIAHIWNERRHRFAVVAVGGLAVLLCVVATRDQVGIWRNTRTLWETTLARRPDTPLARANYAVELNRVGEFDQAMTEARLALDRLPGNRTAHAALAHASLELGDLSTAERHGRIALAIADQIGRPDIPTMTRMIVTLSMLDRLDEAETIQRRLIELEPAFANWRFDRDKREWAPRGKP